MREKKTGLVLEGGGMRGIYTAGVLDVFMENGITFDGVIGVSAGAIHGCSFVSGQALPVSAQSLALDMPACLLITIVALLPLLMKEKGSKIQGLSLILSYSLYLFFVL